METENIVAESDNTKNIENPAIQKEVTPIPIAEPETQEQINWKKFREAREVERKQKIEAERRASEKEAEAQALKAAMEALLNKQTSQSSNSYQTNEDSEETESQRIKRLVSETIDAERKKDQMEKAQWEARELPRKLKENLSDFSIICSQDNIDYLEYHYPAIAKAFNKLPDGYEKWADVYDTIKKLVPNTNSKKEQAKAEKNFNKPQSMSIPGKTQVGDTAPQSLDDRRKADNWVRMQRTMRGG